MNKELKIIEDYEDLEVVLLESFLAGRLNGVLPVETFRKELKRFFRQETIKECVETAKQVRVGLIITSGVDEVVDRLLKLNQNE